ncbi:hypothetical protein A361_06195 [Cytobacillus oceanisediminis 2691]|uniref:Uncharacterized protein n=1 Tax=Cytobacillus oceanisediminis 2691 TaxID=1196031 RepID=A0A160M843_9BACI|nr:hypothetical protein A361_06195 [Cytobacillus oceanisediminis 2691]
MPLPAALGRQNGRNNFHNYHSILFNSPFHPMPLGKNNKHKKNEPVQVRFEKVSEEVCPNKMICKTCSSEWTKALFR